MQYWDAFW